MRRLLTLHHGARCVRVSFDPDWDEYVARLYVGGVELSGASYHTDERSDAESTAWAMLEVDAQAMTTLH